MKFLRKKALGWVAAAALAIGSMGFVPQKAEADVVAILCIIACDDSGCLILCIIFSD